MGLFALKRLLKNQLSSRIQYNFCFLFFCLLALPFLPSNWHLYPKLFSWLHYFHSSSLQKGSPLHTTMLSNTSVPSTHWMNDFSISISHKTPTLFCFILLILWLIGILVMLFLVSRARRRLYHLEKSALPVQNQNINQLFKACQTEVHLKQPIHIYSTAFLKSPIAVGTLKPRIYIPIHLMTNFKAADMRYMFLHELQHIKHLDNLINYLFILAGTLYWFNPLVWYALKEIRNEREIACDCSVLQMLQASDYQDYGHTLINFAEKLSLTPFPFTTSMGGDMKQITKRIINIASYTPASLSKRIKGMMTYILLASLLFKFAPTFSIYAATHSHADFLSSKAQITYLDCQSIFSDYEGSFVLYDETNDSWQIYNKDYATLRVSPASTYKIYAALLGLEKGIISPTDSKMYWNKELYLFDAWNADQDLTSALQNSVNWYFQNIDKQLSLEEITTYIHQIHYGNQTISSSNTYYWLDDSLKISPLEQVQMLKQFNRNELKLTARHIQTVKDGIYLMTTPYGKLYGKTGTQRINEEDISGWFVGFLENEGHTFYFATNIQSNKHATGSNAYQISLDILKELHLISP